MRILWCRDRSPVAQAEPAVDPRVRLAQRKAFEISQRRVHSLHVRDEHQVSRARCCALRTQDPTRNLPPRARPPFVVPLPETGRGPDAPGVRSGQVCIARHQAEQQPFKVTQSAHASVTHGNADGSPLERLKNAVAFGQETPIQFKCREHSRGTKAVNHGSLGP